MEYLGNFVEMIQKMEIVGYKDKHTFTDGNGIESNVYLMDCMELLQQLPPNAFDLAVVDPPYGININMNMGRRAGQIKRHNEKKWDNSTPEDIYFDFLFEKSKNQIIWGGNYFPLPLTKSWIFWDKCVPAGVDFADGELAWTSFSKTLVKASIVYTGFRGMEKGGKVHPTQKPITLYSWILDNYAQEGQSILDTHLGSGSSRIAAYRKGHPFVGCELDEEYFYDSIERFEKEISLKDGRPTEAVKGQISIFDKV